MNKKCVALHKKTSNVMNEYYKERNKSCPKWYPRSKYSSRRMGKHMDCIAKISTDLNTDKVRRKYDNECQSWDVKTSNKLHDN